ncbi:GNAT family N-acetyltransferase [Piscinibacter sakaiensis]|uniref:GNAT family N-acetyltransferase n=1 Tax=Piscinibacter sakaiensis TaxID=1547922 RepID=UPI003AB05A69
MGLEDIPLVVQVHMASFPGFFLSSLGGKFLTCFYTSVWKMADCIPLVCRDLNGKLAGFAVGGVNPSGFYGRTLRRHLFKFCIASVLPLVRNPLILRRLWRGLYQSGASSKGPDVAGLFSIGVSPAVQGHGVGTMLLTAFIAEASDRGCKSVILTTDADNNGRANDFYWKLGFSVIRVYVTPEGRKMNEYSLDIQS